MTDKDTSVLVVDDDARSLQCQRLILEGRGYEVASASSGEEAIEMVADEAPDLILLDIGLPGIDGFTTCKVIRKFSQVPIIMVTGSDSVPDKVRGLDTGADDYVTKPFCDDELFARSQAVLRRSAKQSNGNGSGGTSRVCGKALRRTALRKFSDRLGPALWSARYFVHSLYNQTRAWSARGDDPAPGSSQWSVLMAKSKDLLARARAQLYARSTAAAALFRAFALQAWNAPLARRIKAAPAARKLGVFAARMLASAPLRKVRYEWSRTWRSATSYLLRLRSSPGRGEATPPAAPVYSGDGMENTKDGPPVAPVDSPDTDSRPQATGAPEMAFLERLLRAYLKVAGTICGDPVVSAPVVPLVSVYEEMQSVAPGGDGYSRERFARDVYCLHRSGVDTTLTGARVQFPISRGVPSKTLIITGDDGHEVRYYGIRFMPARDPDRESLPPRRVFDPSAADRYVLEIRDAVAREMEWPSEEFVRFLAGRLNLDLPDHREARQLAQITRDSLYPLVQHLQ